MTEMYEGCGEVGDLTAEFCYLHGWSISVLQFSVVGTPLSTPLVRFGLFLSVQYFPESRN